MIINKIALFINDSIINLYDKGIHFYQILIGLFIFNLIIYIICKMLIESKKVRYY